MLDHTRSKYGTLSYLFVGMAVFVVLAVGMLMLSVLSMALLGFAIFI